MAAVLASRALMETLRQIMPRTTMSRLWAVLRAGGGVMELLATT